MLKVEDPQSWLALPAPMCCKTDRYRDAVPERLIPGDVQIDGTLLRPNGVSQVSGAATVLVDQSYAAAYYGWHPSGVRFWNGGRIYTQIWRDDPPTTRARGIE